MPSASPAFTMRHPKYNSSEVKRRASSIEIPFFLRSSKNRGAYLSMFFSSFGSRMVASPMWVRFSSFAFASISAVFPKRMISANLSASIRSAAVIFLVSAPSGSTMRRGFSLARRVNRSKSSIRLFGFSIDVVGCMEPIRPNSDRLLHTTTKLQKFR